MNNRRLFVFLEGNDDERFFEWVIRPLLEKDYDLVQFWQYGQKKKVKVNGFLNSIKAMQSVGTADLIIAADLDESPCVTDRKERILSSFRGLSAGAGGSSELRSFTQILVVCREIESWYLAGLDDNECQRLGIPTDWNNTDHLSKEQFLSLMPQSYTSKAEFMLEILHLFDHETARAGNRSFSYFMQKYGSND